MDCPEMGLGVWRLEFCAVVWFVGKVCAQQLDKGYFMVFLLGIVVIKMHPTSFDVVKLKETSKLENLVIVCTLLKMSLKFAFW
jgi:hypothetical protein